MSDDAIPAATLIVVRERPVGAPELLMVERAGGKAYAAGAQVFPGGRIDEAD
jgi:8-oxo-dGTP pyrophosphatase MutT (NUDIX family)